MCTEEGESTSQQQLEQGHSEGWGGSREWNVTIYRQDNLWGKTLSMLLVVRENAGVNSLFNIKDVELVSSVCLKAFFCV